jgi:hypothetical protein
MGIAALGEATFPLINQSEDILNGSGAWTDDGQKYVHEITLFSNVCEAQAGIANGKINAVLYVFAADPSDEDMIALYEATADAYGAPQGAYIDLVWSDAQQASDALYGLSFSEMLFVWQHQDYEISVYLCRDGAFRSMYVCFSNPSY